MLAWFNEKKKAIIIGVICAALGAAVPALPPSITAPLANAIYALFEAAPVTPVMAPESK